jgi:ABC-2 type transport system ATP-binding protein
LTYVVEARGLERSFGAVQALAGLDLTVTEGELLGLVGPNGAGKTTFIRTVAGLLAPSGGSVRVFGAPPGRGVAARVGYMTQSPALYDDLTVAENLVFFGRIYGLESVRARSRADELLELVELSSKRKTPVRDLSGGMRQLTNLACAMVHDPGLLLLDEPTVGIDPVLRRTLWAHFESLKAAGRTILLTTHVMDEADRCGRVALIAEGRTIAEGAPAELRETTGTASLEEAYLSFSGGDRAGEDDVGGTPDAGSAASP